MQRAVKIFITYFSVMLVFLQVLANALVLVNEQAYYSIEFYLNTFLGTNLLFSLFLVAYSFYFKFCKISRAASVAELLFALNYLVVQNDSMYNIVFQITVGVLALCITVSVYVNKFPHCTLALLVMFFTSFVRKWSCEKAIADYQRKVIENHIKSEE